MSTFETPTRSHKLDHAPRQRSGRRSSSRISGALGVLCLALCSSSLRAGKDSAIAGDAAARAETAHPDCGFVGVVAPRRSVELAPKLDGRLCEMRVALGDRLSRGDVVAVLERRPTELKLEAASAAMREAQADVNKAKLELADAHERCDWFQHLNLNDSSSHREVTEADHAHSVAAENVNVATARAQQAAAQVEQLRQSLEDCEVRAPFDGAVADVYQQAGAVVGPNIPIARIISDEDLIMRFAVPQDDSARIGTGLSITFRARGGQVVLRGRIERAAPEIDAASSYRIFEARLEAPGDSSRAPLVGLDGRVTCVTGDQRPGR